MNKQIRYLLLTLLFILPVSNGYGSELINGIYYYLSSTYKTAEVVEKTSGVYTGTVIIPSSVVYGGVTYSVTSIGGYAFACSGLTSITLPNSVTSIGYYAFYCCSGLTSITLPNSVTSIGGYAFYCCSGLTSITLPNSVTSIGYYAFDGCSGLTSITLPNSVTSIGDYAFNGCSGLTSITLPNSVTSIGDYAFRYCRRLTSITIPNSVTSIGGSAFSGCGSLTSITLPNSVTSIGEDAFSDCIGLTSITLPNSVTSIGSSAFEGCRGLTSITLPNSVTSIGFSAFSGCSRLTSITLPNSVTSIGNSAFNGCSGLTSITLPNSVTSIGHGAFYGCNLNLIFCGSLPSYDCFWGLATTSVIYAPYRDIETIKSCFSGNVRPLYPYEVDLIKGSLCQMSFKIKGNEGSLIKGTLLSVKMGDTVLSPDESGVYTVKGLAPSTSYGIIFSYKTEDGDIREYSDRFTTKTPTIEVSCRNTQTTLTVSISASSEEGCSPTNLSFTCNGKTYTYTGSPVTVTGLHPNTAYRIESYAYYGTTNVSGRDSYTTSSLNPQVTVNISPNGITAIGSFTKGDAIVTETGFTNYSTGNVLTLTGLEPSSKYAITYYVKTEDGGREECTRNFTTTNLELTTLQPKSVSNSCAIVAAATNLSEEETNAGFQWIKYDAPASLKPSEGYAAIYGNQLEGYIKNIQSTSYYKVRAFYKSAAGEYYYGKWITFDPSDFSYFEPTVHTYPVQEVSHNTVKLKGYVMAGTDNITEQGFQYWVSGTSKSSKMYARATDATSEVSTVLATGQVMTASLESLQPNTTYKYRAFVKTASSTKFGEEQTFTTTNDLTGVDDVKVEETELTVVGYYDINGRKLNTMKSGINLIRYSDGTVRKVMVK